MPKLWKNASLIGRAWLMPRPLPMPEIPPLEPPPPPQRAGNEFHGGAGYTTSGDLSRFFPHRRR